MMGGTKSPVFSFEDLNVENGEYLWPLLNRAQAMFQLDPCKITSSIVALLMDDYRVIKQMEQWPNRKILFELDREIFQDMILYATNEFFKGPEKEGAEELVHYLVSCRADRVHSTVS